VTLKAFFDGVGEITRVNMPMKVADGRGPRENSGFAYVDFATKDAQVLAITMSEQNLEGRRLLIKDGDDYSTKPGGPPQHGGGPTGGLSKTAQKILNAQRQPPGPTLFFGNLSFQTTEQSIRELLDAHRNSNAKKSLKDKDDNEEEDRGANKDPWIRKVRLGTFEDTGVCKGWAFVDFTTTENATAALVNTRNHTLDGRKLRVEYASSDAVRRGGGPGEHRHPKQKEHGSDNGGSGPRQKREHERREMALNATHDSETHEKEPTSGPTIQAESPTQKDPVVKPRVYTHLGQRRPDAVLASAKRSTGSIAAAQGKKLIF